MATEAAECGLACLAMIGRFHGHDVDLNGLRQRFALSMAGVSLRGVMGMADQLGFATRALRVELEALRQVRTPAILHWDLNHFVVLAATSRRGIVVHDPGRGRRELTFEEASQHFTGVVLELTPAAAFAPLTARQPTRLTSLWSKLTGLWPALFQILAISLALQVAVFAAPFYLQLTVDEAILRADRELMTVLALGFGALAVIQIALQALRGYALQVLNVLFSFQMKGNLVRHLLRLRTEFFEKRHVGDILSRLQSSAAIQDAITRGVVATVIDGAMAIIAAVVLFFYSATLAGVVIAALCLSLAATFALYPATRRRLEEQIVAGAKEHSHLIQSVRASTTIKLMGREAERESTWRNLFAEVTNASFSVGRLEIGRNAVQGVITGLQSVIVVYLAARMILAGDGFSIGMLFAFMSFRQTLTDRTLALINQLIQFRLLSLHLERLGDIVHAEPEVAADAVAPPRRDQRRLERRGRELSLRQRRPPGPAGRPAQHRGRRVRRHHRAVGRRQDHAPEADAGPVCADRRAASSSTAGRRPRSSGAPGARRPAWSPRTISSCRGPSPTTSPSSTRIWTWSACRRPPRPPSCTTTSCACRCSTSPWSATWARRCRAGSGNACCWRGRCTASRRCWCWTRARPISTPRPRRRSPT